MTMVQPGDGGGGHSGGDGHNDGGNGGNGGNGGDDGGDVTPPGTPCTGSTYKNVLNALKKRSANEASEAELIAYSQCIMDWRLNSTVRKQAISRIYQGLGDTFSWAPGSFAHYFSVTKKNTAFPLLGINSDDYGKHFYLAVGGEQNGQRFVTLAENPVLNGGSDSATATWMGNIIAWLTQVRNSSSVSYELAGKADKKFHVIIAQMKNRADDGSYSAHYDGIKSWLDKTFPEAYTLNEANSCDYDKLATCLDSQPVDVLILGDRDADERGYEGIQKGIEYAAEHKIPLLTMSANNFVDDMIHGVYDYLGVAATANNYNFETVDYPIGQLLQATEGERDQIQLLKNLQNGTFDPSVFTPQGDNKCSASVLNCNLPAFNQAFRGGANTYRDALTQLDTQAVDVLAQPDKYPVLAAGVLLGDKYREQIDYPIAAADEPAMFQKAMFADWVVDYSRADNIPQPDLGEYAVKANDVVKGQMASVPTDSVISDSRAFSIPYPNQWTTSGWYAPAGKPITISSAATSARVVIQLGFGYSDVYYSAGDKTLVAPSDVSMKDVTRLVLNPGKSVTFSTPYGAPIYIRFTDDSLTSADLSAKGVSAYPALLDFNNTTEINNFEQLVASGSNPYVDIKSTGLELHMLKFRFTEAMGSSDNPDITTTSQLVGALKDYYTWVYTLGGFKIQGKSLSESLPADELSICSSVYGDSDCTDEKLHTRTLIQHINYDQRSRCVGGSGCSGNPFDTSWAVAPYGWGENHELGHNLQTKPLNVAYVDDDKKDLWTAYSERSGENSNNIFPYHTLWQHTWGAGKTTPVTTGHGNPLEVYSVAMSELRGLKDSSGNPVIYDAQCKAYPVQEGTATRYTGPWQNTNTSSNHHEAFYFQMPLQADKKVMRGGETLQNGFSIYTLLYQASRIYYKYASTESDWNLNRDRIGFSLFPWSGDATYGGKTVSAIPGNDFMVVTLSYITNLDWRPYFDMFGLHYTTLASEQVDANQFTGKVKEVVFTNKNNPELIPNGQLSQDPDIVAVDLTDKNAVFPGANWDCH